MAQLHCYVPDPVAVRLQEKAQKAGMSVSRYLGDLIKRDVRPVWPEGYFETVIGGWQGEALERPTQGVYEIREGFLFVEG